MQRGFTDQTSNFILLRNKMILLLQEIIWSSLIMIGSCQVLYIVGNSEWTQYPTAYNV